MAIDRAAGRFGLKSEGQGFSRSCSASWKPEKWFVSFQLNVVAVQRGRLVSRQV